MKKDIGLHHRLETLTYSWLYNKTSLRGLRWKREFKLTNGLIVDAVAYCSLMNKFYKEFLDNLVNWDDIKDKYNKVKLDYNNYINDLILYKGYTRDSVELQNLRKQRDKIQDALMDHIPVNNFMFIFEVKVSQNDLDNTFKRDNHRTSKLSPLGNFNLLVISEPFNLDYVPDFYGVLRKRGNGLSINKLPKFCYVDDMYFYKNAYNLLFRYFDVEKGKKDIEF